MGIKILLSGDDEKPREESAADQVSDDGESRAAKVIPRAIIATGNFRRVSE
jgi:hypothetical protein